MLNKRSRKILKVLNASKPTYHQHGFSRADVCRLTGLTEYDVASCMFLLKRNGYIDYILKEGKGVTGFWLTEEGKFYYTFAFKFALSYVLKYILVPVVVALLTTLITLYVTASLQAPQSQPQQSQQAISTTESGQS